MLVWAVPLGLAHHGYRSKLQITGSRVQPTAPSSKLKLANQGLGTVESIGESQMTLRMDSGRSVEIDPAEHPHLDHGYAVTSHSSQGQTADGC